MLTIDIDAVALKAIDRKLEEMQEKIEQLKHTGLADELADWETQDMHRRRPFVKRRRVGASTTIRPHSLYEMRRRRKVFQRYARRHRRKGRYVTAFDIRTSTRPNLRAELLDRLTIVGEPAAATLKW